MAHIVVLGAGLEGTIMAYELRDELAKEHKVSVVNNGSHYSFVPSNPWVAVGWCDKEAVEVDLAPVLARRGIGLAGASTARSRRRQIRTTPCGRR
jgi:sulfide:quinone oxidoreductase